MACLPGLLRTKAPWLVAAFVLVAYPIGIRDARAQAAFTLQNGTRSFGETMAPLSGGRLAVGSPLEGYFNGRLDFFDVTTGDISLTTTQPASYLTFGAALATLGANVVVGVPGPGYSTPGDIRVIDGTSGASLLTAANPMGAMGDRFGAAVASLGGNIVVGAPGEPTDTNVGNAYVLDGTTGAILVTFSNPTPVSNDEFGKTVAVVGANVVVGAPGDDTAATDAGAVYLFDGATGALIRSFFRPAAAAGEYFGSALAVLGGNILIGALYTGGSGSAELYDASTGALLRTFANPAPDAGDTFGFALATFGDNVLVGAPAFSASALDGSAYLFDGATGALLRSLVAPRRGGYFGFSLGEVDERIAVGEPRGDGRRGNVHLFCGGAAGCGPCETCGPGGSCVAAPNPTCDLPSAGGAALRIIDQPGTDDHVSWRWRKRGFGYPGASGVEFGDPFTVHDYTLCVFDGSGTLRFSAMLPAGGVCGANSCWTAVNDNTFIYRDPDGTPDGVESALLDAPVTQRRRFRVKAAGPLLSSRPYGLPALPLTPPVRAQFQAREGLCWEGVYSAPGKNTTERFIARSD